MKRSDAIHLRSVVEQAATYLDDKTASTAVTLFPRFGTYADMDMHTPLIPAGARINWKGTIKRAAVDMWPVEINNPDNAPTLWEDIAYRLGIRIIPDVITAGTAFAKGEQGWWGDALYESTIDNNVWTPDAWPDGWKAVAP